MDVPIHKCTKRFFDKSNDKDMHRLPTTCGEKRFVEVGPGKVSTATTSCVGPVRPSRDLSLSSQGPRPKTVTVRPCSLESRPDKEVSSSLSPRKTPPQSTSANLSLSVEVTRGQYRDPCTTDGVLIED